MVNARKNRRGNSHAVCYMPAENLASLRNYWLRHFTPAATADGYDVEMMTADFRKTSGEDVEVTDGKVGKESRR